VVVVDVVVVVVAVSVVVEVCEVVVVVVVVVMVVLVDVCVLVVVELVYKIDLVSVTVELVIDQAVAVEVVYAVAIVGDVGNTVVLAETVAAAVDVGDAWLIQSTVVVFVSTPPAIHAGWKTLPSLFVCASVNTIVSEECMQIPYGWPPGVGVGYSWKLPVPGTNFPILDVANSVNQTLRSWSTTIWLGLDPPVGTAQPTVSFFHQFRRQIMLVPIDVNHTNPSWSNVTPFGEDGTR